MKNFNARVKNPTRNRVTIALKATGYRIPKDTEWLMLQQAIDEHELKMKTAKKTLDSRKKQE